MRSRPAGTGPVWGRAISSPAARTTATRLPAPSCRLQQTRHSIYAAAHQDLGDGVRLSLEGRFTRRDFEALSGGYITVLTVSADNPYFVSPTGSASDLIGYNFGKEIGPSRDNGWSQSLGCHGGARRRSVRGLATVGLWQLSRRPGNCIIPTRSPTKRSSPKRSGRPATIRRRPSARRATAISIPMVTDLPTIVRSSPRSAAAPSMRATPIASSRETCRPTARCSIFRPVLSGSRWVRTSDASYSRAAIPLSTRRRRRRSTRRSTRAGRSQPRFAEARIPLFGAANARPGLDRLEAVARRSRRALSRLRDDR
jgi:hypothetical protein